MNRETVTVKVDNLTKSYAIGGAFALKDITFEVYEGEIFGIIGENGSGKTTLLECISGIIPADMGDVTICGFNIAQDPIMAKQRYGYLPGANSLYQEMSGREFLDFIADMYGIPMTQRDKMILKLAKAFSLSEVLDNIIESYSNGMKQKLAIMSSLLHSPRVWLLDEPTNGLDAVILQEFYTLIRNMALDNVTIILSSQNLYALENICDRVAILKNGELRKIVDINKMTNVDGQKLYDVFRASIEDNNDNLLPTD